MKLLNRVLCSAAMLLALGLSADPIPLTEAAAWANKPSPNVKFEDGVIAITGRQALTGKNIYEVDTAKTYKISFQIRATGEEEQTTTYIGYIPLNAAKAEITPMSVFPYAGTEGVLAEDVNTGDTIIKIKPNKAQHWKNVRNYWRVAFDVQPDFSDLPNNKLSPAIKTEETKLDGEVIEIALSKPMTFSATAGTAVRGHSSGGKMYVWHGKATPEWKTVNFVTKGISVRGISAKEFWKGSKFFKTLIYSNWTSYKTRPGIEIKDLQLEILD
ncbi:MAG: hypothetical protein IJJ33_10165 [Victivallales bacterium]|nr:hypothetical protein [Victivallales bacterium]